MLIVDAHKDVILVSAMKHKIKHTISSELKNAIPDSIYAKEYLASIEVYVLRIQP